MLLLEQTVGDPLKETLLTARDYAPGAAVAKEKKGRTKPTTFRPSARTGPVRRVPECECEHVQPHVALGVLEGEIEK